MAGDRRRATKESTIWSTIFPCAPSSPIQVIDIARYIKSEADNEEGSGGDQPLLTHEDESFVSVDFVRIMGRREQSDSVMEV